MKNSLTGRVSAWEILQNNLKPQIAELPHLASDLADLERLIQSGKTLEGARRGHLDAIGATSRERKMITQEGNAVFKRLTLGLRAQFGPQSEKLFVYGVTPEKARRRRASSPEEPPVVKSTEEPSINS